MSAQNQIICNSLDELNSIAGKLLWSFPRQRVFAFYGQMGAGKTTFIKVLCAKLNIEDLTSSPSFSIVNEYRNTDHEPIYHIDFYRIKNISEAYDIGYEEYFYSGYYCFIEWPEKIQQLLPEEHVIVEIKMSTSNENRIFTFRESI